MDAKTVAPITRKRTKKRKIALRVLAIIIGALLVAVGLEIFLVPNNIIDGGVTGVSIMASKLTGGPLGLFLFLLNLPFLLIGYKQIGKIFAVFTLFGVIVMSLGTSYLHHIPSLTDDLVGSSSESVWDLSFARGAPWMERRLLQS